MVVRGLWVLGRGSCLGSRLDDSCPRIVGFGVLSGVASRGWFASGLAEAGGSFMYGLERGKSIRIRGVQRG